MFVRIKNLDIDLQIHPSAAWENDREKKSAHHCHRLDSLGMYTAWQCGYVCRLSKSQVQQLFPPKKR